MRLPGADLLEVLGDRVPADHSRQTIAEHYVAARAGRPEAGPWRVLDLGCGAGGSLDAFRAVDPDVEWTGLDVPDSAEAAQWRRADAERVLFDGETVPFPDGAFDLVYCKQVLEHVRRPAPLAAEVARVLRPGGVLAGSTSQLELFHSRSTFGYTPHGLSVLLEDAGLEVLELRPSIDALALLARRALRAPRYADRWWAHESPLNRALELAGRRATARERNAAKLILGGQFCFLARRTP